MCEKLEDEEEWVIFHDEVEEKSDQNQDKGEDAEADQKATAEQWIMNIGIIVLLLQMPKSLILFLSMLPVDKLTVHILEIKYKTDNQHKQQRFT